MVVVVVVVAVVVVVVVAVVVVVRNLDFIDYCNLVGTWMVSVT